MKSTYKLSIPKPCHENWSEMTPNDKGRFCQSCSKTVVDFTHMKTNDIQEFIRNNKDQRICGHIRQNQLDAINLQISDTVFEQTMSFHKLFLLALLLAMGTSLFSCADDKGNIKKIERIEIVEKSIDSVDAVSLKKETSDSIDIEKPTPPIIIPEIMGDMIMVEGEMEVNYEEQPHSWYSVDEKPNFVDAPKDLTDKEIKDYFNKRMSDFVTEHFNTDTTVNLGLSGRQRVITRFTIDEYGNVKDILARGPHVSFEKEAKRVIELLPQFIPGKYDGENVEITYDLPIIFNIED
jgi:hypothetical protein